MDAAPATAEDGLPGGDSADRGDAPREKRSRDRYGRERKPRGDRTERPAGDGTDPVDAQTSLPLGNEAESAQDNLPRKSYFSTPAASAPVASEPAAVSVTAAAEPGEASAAVPVAAMDAAAPAATLSVTAAPAPAALVAAEPAAVRPAPAPKTPVAAPVVATLATGTMPKVQPYSLPLQDLAQLAQSSGLNWVMSDAEKVAAAQAAIAAQPEPVRVPRERPAPVVADEGPLVLVETRRDLRDITLPFEQTETQ
jgi:ribonuclease E